MPGVIKQIEIPEINPIRWVKEDSPLSGLNTVRPDDWFKDQQNYHKVDAQYYQKFTFDMPVVAQIFLGGQYTASRTVGPLNIPALQFTTMQVYDCRGTKIADIPITSRSAISGNVIYINNVPVSMSTINWKTTFAAHDITQEGIYYFRLQVAYVTNNNIAYDYWISEPILLATEHEGTVLIEYTSYNNKLNSQFAAPFLQYSMRVEGMAETNALKRFQSGYKDQKQNPRLQNAEPYRETIFRMGYPTGVPVYLLDKINRAFCCDVVSVDKIRYVADTDQEIQISKKDPLYNLVGATYIIYEADNDEAGITGTTTPLNLYERNLTNIDTPSYLVYQLALSNSNDAIVKVIFIGYEINNIADEDGFIASMNSYWIPKAGLNGYIKRDGGNIVYMNGGGEYYDTTNSVILIKKIELLYAYSIGTGSAIGLDLTLKAVRAAVVPKHNYEVYCMGSPTGSTMVNQSFTYGFGSDTEAQVRLWHDDNIEEMYIRGLTFYNIAPDSWPLGLKVLDISQTGMTTFDFGAVDNSLVSLSITNSKLATLTSFNVKNWHLLVYIGLHHNKINITNVDKIFNDHQSSTTLPNGGQFNIRSQTPTAHPSTASLTARNNLASHFWIVTTD
jgi:hypothetical protein